MYKSGFDVITSSLEGAKQPRNDFLKECFFELALLCVVPLRFLFLFEDPFE